MTKSLDKAAIHVAPQRQWEAIDESANFNRTGGARCIAGKVKPCGHGLDVAHALMQRSYDGEPKAVSRVVDLLRVLLEVTVALQSSFRPLCGCSRRVG